MILPNILSVLEKLKIWATIVQAYQVADCFWPPCGGGGGGYVSFQIRETQGTVDVLSTQCVTVAYDWKKKIHPKGMVDLKEELRENETS